MIKLPSIMMHDDPKCYHCKHSIWKQCDDRCLSCKSGFNVYRISKENPINLNKWIKCSEQMPEDGYRCFVYGKFIPCESCGKSGNKLEIEYCKYDKDDSCWLYGEYDCEFDATHWQPLPEPPKDNEEIIPIYPPKPPEYKKKLEEERIKILGLLSGVPDSFKGPAEDNE